MAVPVYVGDRVLVSTDTTGTGTYELGASVSGYLAPANAGVASGSRVAYVVVDSLTNPSTFEVGEGTYTAGSPATVSRNLIVRNSSGGTSAVSWSAGTKYLFLAPSASRFVMYDSDGGMTLNTHLTLVSGAASSVAVSTPGDRDTGLFFPGPDRVALATNGSTRLEFSATGKADFKINPSINGSEVIKASDFVTDAGTTGSMTLPNGVIMKWGTGGTTNGAATITFASAFPAACYNIQATITGGDGAQTVNALKVGTYSTTGFNIYSPLGTTYTFLWQAIGV